MLTDAAGEVEVEVPAGPRRHVRLVVAGARYGYVASRLGHADPAITLRVYAYVLREQAAGVADVFARAVEG